MNSDTGQSMLCGGGADIFTLYQSVISVWYIPVVVLRWDGAITIVVYSGYQITRLSLYFLFIFLFFYFFFWGGGGFLFQELKRR